jgi:hypothetical protein
MSYQQAGRFTDVNRTKSCIPNDKADDIIVELCQRMIDGNDPSLDRVKHGTKMKAIHAALKCTALPHVDGVKPPALQMVTHLFGDRGCGTEISEQRQGEILEDVFGASQVDEDAQCYFVHAVELLRISVNPLMQTLQAMQELKEMMLKKPQTAEHKTINWLTHNLYDATFSLCVEQTVSGIGYNPILES